MTAMQMYDYLSDAVPDVDITLGAAPYDIHPQGVISERGEKNQTINQADDVSEERISK